MRPALSSAKASSGGRSRGAVIVEFAIMLPLLVLILLMIVDLGWVLRESQILQNAAREGAHFSAMPANQINPGNPNASVTQIRQFVIDYCAQENITVQPGDITVDQNWPIQVGTNWLEGSLVTISYQRPFIIHGTGLLPTSQLTLVGQAVFVNFYAY